MGKIGKISPIRKKFPVGEKSVEATLANTYNKNRFPGTGITKLPYKNGDGTYRTGLEDKPEEKERLERVLRIPLNPDSDYYNYTSNALVKVNPMRLKDEDNIFNLDDAEQAVTYYWLSAHPTIASSWDAWDRGEYPSDTQFFVNNADIESEKQYQKDMAETKALLVLNSLSIEKLRKVARLLGFPVSDDSKPEHVFPKIYSFIKEGMIKAGPYKNQNSITKFNQIVSLGDDTLHITDLVEKALRFNIFRESSGGRLMKGEVELAKSKQDFIDYLGSKKGQEDLLLLEKDLKVKESIAA